MDDDRRTLWITAGLMLTSCATVARAPRGGGPVQPDREGISAAEGLSREHGLVHRVLGVYDDAGRRIAAGEAMDPSRVHRAADVVMQYIHGFHEEAEEAYVFPRLERVEPYAATVRVLHAQHHRGKAVTEAVLRLTARSTLADVDARTLATLMAQFARLYRPHAAREDTEVFPALRTHLGRDALSEIAGRIDAMERSRVGADAFARNVEAVAAIEREAGIDDLAAFTPAVPGA